MRMYFLDSTEDKKHEYNQNDFARFHNQIIGTGVSDVGSLTVSAKNNMEIALSTGWIFANGFSLEIENTKTLEHDVAHPDNDRIDRVVVRFDTNPEGLDFYPVIKKGTPAKDPVAPSLTRDNYIYEMSVAQVLIKAGKSYVEDDEITDERENDEVCGYIDLHNIYRGLFVNEYGMVTMPNQSYVEMDLDGKFTLDGDIQYDAETYPNFYHTKFKIDAKIDRQNEINNGKFIAKADGTYMFSVHTKLLNTSDRDDDRKLEAQIEMNNGGTDELLYLFNNYLTESQYMGSNMIYLKKGDVAELTFGRRYKENIDLMWVRLNIAKLN